MADLIAQSFDNDQRWRRKLIEERSVTVGRTSADWLASWDEQISREHFRLDFRDGSWQVVRLPEGRNALYYRGSAQDRFTLLPGEHFVVGNTTFTLVEESIVLTSQGPSPDSQQSFNATDLRQRKFVHPDQRILALSRLPELMTTASNDQELWIRLVNLLLLGIPQAMGAAVVCRTPGGLAGEPIRVLHWDRRLLGRGVFSPSERLVRQALDERQSVLHIWNSDVTTETSYTTTTDEDWAFCTPLPHPSGLGWAFYVAGEITTAAETRPDLRDDLKFAEILATTVGNLRQNQQLERRQASLRSFFSPLVLEALATQDPEIVLTPREADVAVLFCDLRGFSLESQRSAGDLLGLLDRVSRALGVMTHEILEQGGVIGDFHGDSAMGFWGWPLQQDDGVQRACRAALRIRSQFAATARTPEHPLSNFRIGIGIGAGRAVAGKIGTLDQVKVTVFGPVVNLAARLEAMTRQLGAAILVDEVTAKRVGRSMERDELRVRRVAIVRPLGLESPVEVNEIVPPFKELPQLTDAQLDNYQAALDWLISGDWPRAMQMLTQIPGDDSVRDFLANYIAGHGSAAPADWDGAIRLQSK